jgi:hypothetical protein
MVGMIGMKSLITIKAWRRPKMLGTVLSNLAKCYGVENHDIFISIDDYRGGELDEEFDHEIFKSGIVKKSRSVSTVHQGGNLGCAGNTLSCFERAFKYGDVDYMMHLEDDTVPAIDYIKFMEWAYSFIGEHLGVFCVCPFLRTAHQRSNDIQVNYSDISKVTKRPFFDPAGGLGIRKEEYKIIENAGGLNGVSIKKADDDLNGKEWVDDVIKNGGKLTLRGSWAWYFRKMFAYNSMVLYPYINRVQNIGDIDGKWNPNPAWHRKNIYNDKWSGSPDYKNVDLNKLEYVFNV